MRIFDALQSVSGRGAVQPLVNLRSRWLRGIVEGTPLGRCRTGIGMFGAADMSRLNALKTQDHKHAGVIDLISVLIHGLTGEESD